MKMHVKVLIVTNVGQPNRYKALPNRYKFIYNRQEVLVALPFGEIL